MTDKLYEDFTKQKEFTENASHEMQTPLAVIKAELNLLMQSKNLKETEMLYLHGIERSVKKLSTLNKTLLLLTKIDNNQFTTNQAINLNRLIEKQIEQNEEFLKLKNCLLKYDFENELVISMSNELAEILLFNLIQNAIRHNEVSGIITIKVKENKVIIANSGNPLTLSKDDLFVRFKKNDASKDSLGLGLSIVKSIANIYNLLIAYTYENKMHIFTIIIPKDLLKN
jgi:signal transduction histidine kinase